MGEKTTTTKLKPDLRPVEVGVGAAAAVITAFASSYLGTAGTLTGAALASIVGTVSTSVLRTSVVRTNESLQRTTARLRQTIAGPEMGGSTAVDPGIAAVDVAELAAAAGASEPAPAGGTAPAGAGVDDQGAARRGDRTGPAEGGHGAAVPPPAAAGAVAAAIGGGTARALSRRPGWLVLAVGAVLAFLVALVAITGIESAFGKPLAALIGNETGGGTTIGRAVTGDSAPSPRPTPASTPDSSATEQPSVTPSTIPPSDSPVTGSPSAPAGPEPTDTATPAPSASVPAPTPAPSRAPSP